MKTSGKLLLRSWSGCAGPARACSVALAATILGVSPRAVAHEEPAAADIARVPPTFGGTSATPASPPPPPPPEERPRRPWFGGLGYASIAPYFGSLSGLESGLRQHEALGESYGVGKTALLLGGGGGAVLFSHLWIGGKGYGLLTTPFDNARGEAHLTGGGGGIEIGYVLNTNPRMLIIPFFGMGGFGYSLELTNKTTQPMPIDAFSIAPGESRTFSAGMATVEAGLRLQRLLFFRNGGMTAGFEIGILRSIMNGPWHTDGNEFTHQDGASVDGVYARVNIGGGGFVYR